ncbi:unnamed protein product [Rotaria sp. Silwood1]|nr:unnamed protein product [Rotaria sp. Silwood1]
MKNLSEKFKVENIPALIILSVDGGVLIPDGIDDINSKGADAIRAWAKDGQEPSAAKPYLWPGVTCNGCEMNPLVGERHKCSTCDNYNLCSECQKKGHAHALTIVPDNLATVGEIATKNIDPKP